MEMKYRLKNCSYDLIKDLLMSQDSWVDYVSYDSQGVIVSLKSGHSRDELERFLHQGPLMVFCQNSIINEIY